MVKKYIALLAIVLAIGALALPLTADAQAKPSEQAIKAGGAVVDWDGKPITKAKVSIQANGQRNAKSVVIYTDKAGKFSASIAAPANSYISVNAEAPGYISQRAGYRLQNANSISIKLGKAGKFKGIVVDENGKPLEGAKVTLEQCYGYAGNGSNYTNTSLPREEATKTTGKDGTFVFDKVLRAEDYTYAYAYFAVGKTGRANIRKNVDKAGLSGTITITDPQECKIAGTLYLPGKTGTAPEGTELMVKVSFGNSAEGRNARIGKEGKFEIGQLPPGKVDIMLGSTPIRMENGKWITDDPYPWALPAQLGVEVSPEAPKDLDMVLVPGALIKGKVIDKKTSKPYASARLNITHPGRPQSAFNDWAMTNESGEFKVRVMPGRATISIDTIEDPSQQIYFQPNESPTVSFNMADGEEKTDAAIKVDPNDRESANYPSSNNPITPGFELKSGSYDMTWDPEIKASYSGYTLGKYYGREAKSRIKKLPENISDKACFAACAFDTKDDGLLYVILDRSNGKNTDKAYIDLNRNGDLSDDQPVEVRGSDYQKRTDWFTVQSHQGAIDGEGADHPIEMRLNILDSESTPNIMLDRKGAWKCRIETNKDKVDCIIADMNNNGIYGDASNGEYPGDIIFVDANGSGEVTAYQWGPQAFSIYKLTKVADKFYSIATNKLGSKLTIEPYMGAMGKLVVRGENIQGMKADVSSINVKTANGIYTFENTNDRPVNVPAGSYELQSCSMSLGGKLPISWSSNSKIDVNEGKIASLPVKGRLSMAICKDQKELVFRQRNTGTINWDINIGNNIKLDSIGDRNANQTPTVKFYNKAGKLVHTTGANYT